MSDLNPEWVEKAAEEIYEELQHPNWRAPQWDEIDEHGRERFLNAARAALEAVADDLRAEALREAAHLVMGPSDYLADSATCRHIANELLARASRIEAGS